VRVSFIGYSWLEAAVISTEESTGDEKPCMVEARKKGSAYSCMRNQQSTGICQMPAKGMRGQGNGDYDRALF